jgi:hypothetical protein
MAEEAETVRATYQGKVDRWNAFMQAELGAAAPAATGAVLASWHMSPGLVFVLGLLAFVVIAAAIKSQKGKRWWPRLLRPIALPSWSAG